MLHIYMLKMDEEVMSIIRKGNGSMQNIKHHPCTNLWQKMCVKKTMPVLCVLCVLSLGLQRD